MSDENNNPFVLGDGTKAMGTISALIGAIIASQWRSLHGIGSWTLAIAIIVVFLVSGLIYDYLKKTSRQTQQKEREQNLPERINESIDSGEVIPYYLYFRPFDSTKTIIIPDMDPDSVLTFGGDAVKFEAEDLEMIITRVVYPALLSGLGSPGEAIGAARIKVTDSEWKKEAKKLAKNAKGVFLLPAVREGTIWEVNLILSNPDLLQKTMFIMPPKLWFTFRFIKNKKFDIPKEWKKLCKEFSKKGVFFPEFDKKGMLFTMAKNGKLKNYITIKDWSINNDLREAINIISQKQSA